MIELDPESFNKSLIDLTAEIMLFKGDVIVGIESRGFLFGTPLARDLEVPFILARKPGKLPNKTVSKKYQLEYGEAELHLQLLFTNTTLQFFFYLSINKLKLFVFV